MARISHFRDEYAFLSNFYPCEIDHRGRHYMSVEAAYQASKCLDWHLGAQFESLSPPEARKLGRKIPLRPDWEKEKDRIMRVLIQATFMGNHDLQSKLLQTGDAELVEENTWHDNHFGNCICSKCADVPGENVLGKELMRIREKLRKKNYYEGEIL